MGMIKTPLVRQVARSIARGLGAVAQFCDAAAGPPVHCGEQKPTGWPDVPMLFCGMPAAHEGSHRDTRFPGPAAQWDGTASAAEARAEAAPSERVDWLTLAALLRACVRMVEAKL